MSSRPPPHIRPNIVNTPSLPPLPLALWFFDRFCVQCPPLCSETPSVRKNAVLEGENSLRRTRTSQCETWKKAVAQRSPGGCGRNPISLCGWAELVEERQMMVFGMQNTATE